MLFGHRYDQLPVGATTALDVEAGRGVRARFRWLKGDEFADRVRNAFDQGVLRAASVGFIPRESSPRAGSRGLHITKWEIVEWSLCCVPSNPSAVRTLKGLGLWQDDVVFELADAPVENVVLEVADDAVADARRYIAAQAAKAATDTLRAHGLVADPLADPTERRYIQDVMRSVIRDSIRQIASTAAEHALRRARGRLD